MSKKKRNENFAWKFDEKTGKIMYLRARAYFSVWMAFFVGAMLIGIMAMMSGGEKFNLSLVVRVLPRGLLRASGFLLLFYEFLAIFGWFMHIEGDAFTSRIYEFIERMRIAKIIQVQRKETKDIHEDHAGVDFPVLPICILVCEKLSEEDGKIRRTQMCLNARKFVFETVLFEAQTSRQRLDPQFVFEGVPAESLIEQFNAIETDNYRIRFLDSCDVITIKEMSLIYPEVNHGLRHHADNMVKLHVRTISCTSKEGKLIVKENPT